MDDLKKLKELLKTDTEEDIKEKIKTIENAMQLEILEQIKIITNKYKDDLDYFNNKLKEKTQCKNK